MRGAAVFFGAGLPSFRRPGLSLPFHVPFPFFVFPLVLVLFVLAACSSQPAMPEANLPYTILYRDSWKDLKSLLDMTGRIFHDYGALFDVGEEDAFSEYLKAHPTPDTW